MRETVRYSEAFKRGIVEKIAQGKYKSLSEAGRKNGIKGKGTAVTWLKKYGRDDMLPKRIRVETMKEIDGLQAAKKRVRELEAVLADAHMGWTLPH